MERPCLHLTGEVEFDLRGNESEVEYAQIDFLVTDYLAAWRP
jgi:hypothetical protein